MIDYNKIMQNIEGLQTAERNHMQLSYADWKIFFKHCGWEWVLNKLFYYILNIVHYI